MFEPDLAFVRHLRVGSAEVLRGVSAPVRNRSWGTVPPVVTIIALDRQPDHFTLSFDVRAREQEVDFLWHGTLVGEPDGTLTYRFDGEALSDFERNRIGFCVLHGETAAGRPWLLEHTDGERATGNFPERIAPHQPALALRAVSHEFAPGSWARVEFEGDVFEMEDQRNWTDASFKTYCTPLALPYPVAVPKGTKVRQKLTITLDGEVPAPVLAEETEPAVVLEIGDDVSALPGIGTQVSSQGNDLDAELGAQELRRLAALHLDHLRVDLTPSDGRLAGRLRLAAGQARRLDRPLLAGLHLGKHPAKDLETLVAECRSVQPPISTWLVIGADDATFALARKALEPLFPEAAFGIGHDTNFTELNRNRPGLVGLDVASYGINPQVHAFDDASIVETLPIQAETVRTARPFLGTAPILVSPVTLRVQAVKQEPRPGELPSNVDPRQPSLFAAGWTVGSINSLAAAGVDRVTYYETVGWKGIMASGAAVAPHDAFPARPGAVYPIYHVLHAVGDFVGGRVRMTTSTDPGSIVGLALDRDGRRRLLVANLTDRPRTVSIRGYGDEATVHLLTADAPAQAAAPSTGWVESSPDPIPMAAPLRLPPYGIARIDDPRR